MKVRRRNTTSIVQRPTAWARRQHGTVPPTPSMARVIEAINATWPVEQSDLWVHEAAAAHMALAERFPKLRSFVLELVEGIARDRDAEAGAQ